MPKRKSPPLRAAERREIERGLDAGGSVRSIAASIGRCPSTVAREVRANRVPANPALRARPEELPAPDCPRLQGSPGVCNACPRLRGGPCGHRRWVYRAGAAAVESDRRRRESREGIDMEPSLAREALALVGDGVRRGMSPYEISATMPERCRVSPGTIYGWVERGYAGACNLHLQRKVSFKPRKRRAKGAARPRRPEARSHAAFLALGEEECASAWEMDSLVGFASDRRRLLTLYSRPSKLQLALPLDGGSCGAVRDALGRLRGLAPGAFGRVFGLVLTDNGPEFSDWDALGGIFGEPAGGAPRLFYCDPLASGQKGGCEKNHTELRRVLAKGLFSFDLLVEADLSLAMSHVNSAPRRSLMGLSPIEVFLAATGPDGAALLGALGVERVPPSGLLLRPSLLNEGRAARGAPPLPL